MKRLISIPFNDLMAILKTEAIVLKRYDLRETSLLVSFYTLDYGKLIGELKGIREEPQKFASSLELFSHNEIIIYQKRNSSIHLVSQCDLKNDFSPIRQSITKITTATLIVELLDKIMAQEDKNPDVFRLALVALSELSLNNNPDKVMTIFKIKVLDLSGFKPHLDSCVNCGSSFLGQVKFSLSLGGLLCSKCNNMDRGARSIYRGSIATILHIERNDFKSNLNLGMNPEVKKELDLILNSFLNFHLGKELKSQKVINSLLRDGSFDRAKLSP